MRNYGGVIWERCHRGVKAMKGARLTHEVDSRGTDGCRAGTEVERRHGVGPVAVQMGPTKPSSGMAQRHGVIHEVVRSLKLTERRVKQATLNVPGQGKGVGEETEKKERLRTRCKPEATLA